MMSRPLPSLLAIALMTVLIGPAGAAEPAAQDWDPVQQALTQGSEDAARRLDDFIARFPSWAGGYLARSRLKLARNDLPAALIDAQEAQRLAPTRADALALTAHLLTRTGSPAAARKLIEGSPQRSEPWPRYHLAEAAFTLGEIGPAQEQIQEAKRAAGAQVPAEFHILEGAILTNRGAWAAAAKAYRAGLDQRPELAEGWYNLGVVERRRSTAGDPNSYEPAIQALTKAAQLRRDDPQILYALGQSQLDRGQPLEALPTLETALKHATGASHASIRPGIRASLGTARLNLARTNNPAGSYAAAATDLEQAVAENFHEPWVLENLAVAFNGAIAADPGQAAHLIERQAKALTRAGSAGLSLVNLGMSDYLAAEAAFSAQQHGAALQRAVNAAGSLQRAGEASAGSERGPILRYQGHALALAAKAAAATGDNANAATHTRQALDAYAAGGDAGDRLAQQFHLAVAQDIDGPTAYAAGWRHLAWRGWVEPSAWAAIIGNYGRSEACRSPLHLAIWGLIIAVLLLSGLKAFFPRRSSVPVTRSGAEDDDGTHDEAPQRRRPAAAPAPTGQSSSASRRPTSVPPKAARPATTVRDGMPSRPAPRPATKTPAASERKAVADVAKRILRERGPR